MKSVIKFMILYCVLFIFSSIILGNAQTNENIELLSSTSSINETESNDKYTSANSVKNGQSVTGNLSSFSDKDYYKITVSSNGILKFQFNHVALDADFLNVWQIYLYGSDGQTSPTSSSGNYYESISGKRINYTSPGVGVKAGTYYYKVCHESITSYHSDVSYTLTPIFEESSSSEIENNNSIAKANLVLVNSEHTGSLSDDNDVDFYKFELPQAGYVSATFKHAQMNYSVCYWEIRFIDENGTNVTGKSGEHSVFGDDATTSTPNYWLPAGTFYFYVEEGAGNSTLQYSFILNYEAKNNGETEPNSTSTTSDTIKTNLTYSGALSYKTDIDYYKFVVKQTSKIQFTFSHKSSGYAVVAWEAGIYDSLMGKKVEYSYNQNNTGDTEEEIELSAGTYYLVISVGDYSSSWKGHDYSFMIDLIHNHSYGSYSNVDNNNHEKICSICENALVENHSWISSTIKLKPTCKEEGIQIYKCSKCSATQEVTLEKTNDHSHSNYIEYNNEKHSSSCNICDKVEYFEHRWNNGEISINNTCTKDGEKLYTCKDCGETKTEVIAAAHKWSTYSKKNADQHTITCSVCNETKLGDHEWDSGSITVPSSCASVGTKTFTCVDCEEVKYTEIPKLSTHKWSELKQKDTQEHTKSCTVCNEVFISKHNFTCQMVDDNNHKHECICGYSSSSTHNYAEWTIDEEATQSSTGQKSRLCEDCGHKEIETISKLKKPFVMKPLYIALVGVGLVGFILIIIKKARRKK